MTTIAIAGKGGTGKTSLAGLMIDELVRARYGSVLAIDADPSSNLHSVLGLPLPESVGDIREEMLTTAGRGAFVGLSRHDYAEYRIQEALVESCGLDLLAMGRPEGPGCYCAANNTLRLFVDRLSGAYDYVVIDNEAGLEHLSRRTTRDVDYLLVVSDPTMRGIEAARRVLQLVSELKTTVHQSLLAINRTIGPLSGAVAEAAALLPVEHTVTIPLDPQVAEFDAVGRPLVALPPGSPMRRGAAEVLSRIVPEREHKEVLP